MATSDKSSDKEWQRKTASDKKWLRAIANDSDREWQGVAQQMRTNKSK